MLKKISLVAVLGVAIALSFSLLVMGGCGKKAGGQDDYQKGYEDGVKAEQAKWSSQKMQLAKTMIEEQDHSQENILRLLKGEIANATLDSVTVEGDAAKVTLTVYFKDGTIVKGLAELKKIDGSWYFSTITKTQ